MTDVLDKSNTWCNSKSAAFRIESSNGINLRNILVKGMKPFDIWGNDIEIQFADFKIEMPFNQKRNIEYGIILSEENFNIIIQDIPKYAKDVVLSYKNLKNFKQEEIFQIQARMEYYFFDESIMELEIDKFIYDNPIILEVVFGLENGRSQVNLVDQSGQLKPNLKPDLIAYDFHNKVWTIVDYKRSKSELLKRVSKVRSSYLAEVNDLKAQLKDYIEYFDDNSNRKYYEEAYGDDVEYPQAIGIIGKTPPNYVKDFNRLKRDHPN